MSITHVSSGIQEEELVTPLDFEELEHELAVAPKTGITARESHLIKVKTLYALAASIAGIFLNIYLFHLGGFAGVVKYCMAEMAAITFGFVIAGTLMRRFSSVRILQAGVLLSAAVYVTLLLLGASAIEYVLILGFMAGLGEGLYWTSNNLSEFVVTTGPTRNAYFGRSAFWGSLIALFAPPAAGGLVYLFDRDGTATGTSTGYYILFGFLVVTLVAVAVSAQKMVNTTGLRFKATQVFRTPPPPGWRLVLVQKVLRGMWTSALPALTPVLLLTMVHGELAVGLLTAASAIVGAIFARIAGRLLRNRPSMSLVGAIFVPLSMAGFALGADWFAVFCLAFLMKAVDPFSAIPAGRVHFDCMDADQVHWRDSFHRIVETEVALNIGRVLSYLIVLSLVGAAGSSGDVDSVRIVILVGAVLPVLAGAIQLVLDRVMARQTVAAG